MKTPTATLMYYEVVERWLEFQPTDQDGKKTIERFRVVRGRYQEQQDADWVRHLWEQRMITRVESMSELGRRAYELEHGITRAAAQDPQTETKVIFSIEARTQRVSCRTDGCYVREGSEEYRID